MPRLKPLPSIWLISDARNDAGLERALHRLPRGSGLIFRHYHLEGPDRLARFRTLHRIAKSRGHTTILADSAMTASEWGADGIYGAPRALYPRRVNMLQLATAHNLTEIGLANRLGADGVLLSPVYATRSHPGAPTLGPLRFRHLARHSRIPVIALGGMDALGAHRLQWSSWAAIDGLGGAHA